MQLKNGGGKRHVEQTPLQLIKIESPCVIERSMRSRQTQPNKHGFSFLQPGEERPEMLRGGGLREDCPVKNVAPLQLVEIPPQILMTSGFKAKWDKPIKYGN